MQRTRHTTWTNKLEQRVLIFTETSPVIPEEAAAFPDHPMIAKLTQAIVVS